MITVRAPDGEKAVAAVTVRTPTGDNLVAAMTLRTPTGDKLFYTQGGATLTVTATPISAVGSGFVTETTNVTSNDVTAAASGGTAPYTYAWTRIAGSTSINALSASAATTRFRASVAPGDTVFATFRCTATDARGQTGTVDVDVTLYN